jgi:hypothetical protein
MVLHDDIDYDPDPEIHSLLIEQFGCTYSSPERRSLSGSHGQRRGFSLK